MRIIYLCAAAIVMVAVFSKPSFGHGFLMFRNGNQIDAMTENVPVIHENLFSSTTFSAGDGFAAEHGAVQAESGSGFDTSIDKFRMDLTGILWYSAGGPPVKAAEGITLTGLNQYTAQKLEISRDGVAPLYPGFSITGADNHEVFWTLTGPLQAGVYGVAYRVSGLEGGNAATPYETSDLLVVAFSTVGFSNLNAVEAVYAAATAIPGDFDLDGDVDGADFVVWQTNFPSTNAELITGDADLDGDVDGADFVSWQTNFPTSPAMAAKAVPEMNSLLLAASGIVAATTVFQVHSRRGRRQL